MDADEREVCDFLKAFPGQFISGREIARRAGGKWKFHDDPNWAVPVLSRLKDNQVIESNATGQFRLVEDRKKEKKKKWISPQIQKILDESGKDFSDVVGEGEPTSEGEPKGTGDSGIGGAQP